MTDGTTSTARPKGRPVPDWRAPPCPGPDVMQGRHARLERLAPHHAPALHHAFSADDAVWDYLPYGPFDTLEGQADWVARMADGEDPYFYAIHDLSRPEAGALGVASYLRIAPAAGSVEVGHINFAPALQRTVAATEAMALMMGWAFDAGYRRYEWKCDALNAGSRRAAQRLGFSFEGVFRQAAVIKGRNRDTAWFAACDGDWPALREAFDRWLSPGNFDAEGRQRASLVTFTAPVRVASDPEQGG